MQWGTHLTAFIEGVWNWVYFKDMTELVPIVDVFLVGPIQGVEFPYHGKVKFIAIFLAKPFKFHNGRIFGLILESRISREKYLQWFILIVRLVVRSLL